MQCLEGAVPSTEPETAMELSPANRKLAVVLLAACFWLSPFQGRAVAQTAIEPGKTVSEPSSGVIPLAEVPMQAAEALDFLHSLKMFEIADPEIEGIERALTEQNAQIGLELAATKTMLRYRPRLFALQARLEHWRQLQLKLTGWLRLATERMAQLRDALQRLDHLRKIWTQTLALQRESNASGAIVQQIESTASAIEAADAATLFIKRIAAIDPRW